ncbi:hydrolase with alpha/beta-hydrolase fold [Psychromonas ingrahamii 37]|uniref:Hydrolase with alpha/beta-hydrolase fold n=1 Tax=Psychromonas ingrahamii (strain DSM 17664 / CCUG 51855 / 37) TaxID=357804 RepID=A1SSD1_PSYIN|nr:alpha/beta fold hydrolase [Psychromonas ingrahamii]ABM02396.1 hydrolase with alpha/beta-hydrolase fold [Psychromonas ingrahamii 37]
MNLIYNGPTQGPLFVFAHGAGAPANADFMEKIAVGLALRGIRVARFNFAYMQQRIDNGTRRPPERAEKLVVQFGQLIAKLNQPMVIGGKSMGGRIASLLAAELADDKVKGIVCLGYPFHPVGKPETLRTAHLPSIQQKMLIIQGERDKLGTREEVQSYGLPKEIQWLWLEDGDHDLKPRVKSGFTHQAHLQKALDKMALFIISALDVKTLDNPL